MPPPSASRSISPAVDPLQLFGLGELTAEALPPLMTVPDPRGP